MDETLRINGRARLAAVISHPIQHFAPLFRLLAAVPGLDLKVFYCCDWGSSDYHDPGFGRTLSWDIPLLEGYDYEFLPLKKRPRELGFWEVDNPSVAERLAAFAPQAIYLHGYSQRTIWRAAKWGQRRCALLHFGDSELVHPRRWWRRGLKRIALRYHFRRIDAFITIGDNNEAYYRHFGVPDNKMFRGAYPIDVQRFRTTIATNDRNELTHLRARYGLPAEAFVALFVGKFQPSKRPRDFVAGIAQANQGADPIYGLMIGDGPLRQQLEEDIHRLHPSDRIRIAGFVNQAELPNVLWAGDVLVSTSEKDPHPLVVSESMAVGLPVVVSDRVGCLGPTDAARPDVNALVFPCGDVPALAAQLRRLSGDHTLRQRMSAASAALAGTQDASVTAQAIVNALHSVRDKWPLMSAVHPRENQEGSAALRSFQTR